MSIIQTQTTKTVESIKNRIINTNLMAYNTLKRSVIDGFNGVWRDKEFTPQDILTAFGTDAKALFELSWRAQQLLKSLDDSWVYLIPDYEVTFDDAGNATVGNKKDETTN